jgi:hypothetical protein
VVEILTVVRGVADEKYQRNHEDAASFSEDLAADYRGSRQFRHVGAGPADH